MMVKKNIKLGEPISLELSKRYYQFNRQYAVRDVFDGLVELITNSDDSYHRLFDQGILKKDGGPILIEYMQKRSGQPSIIRVRDRAEGMTLNDMLQKLLTVGERQSLEGDRGFMARGAKDCTELGEMLVESIKDNRYYACKLTPNSELIPIANGEKVDKGIRQKLGILRDNGTAVTITIDPRHKTPNISTVIRDLPWLFSLRDILAQDNPTKVQIINLNEPKSKPEPIVYRLPKAEYVLNNIKFEVPGYSGIYAYLTLYKAKDPFEVEGDRRFRKSGLLIKGKRAIHECSLLKPEFEKDPNSTRYFGRIDCTYIDDLLIEYDEYRNNGVDFPKSNPRLLIDPNRRTGLIREHPFTQALFQVPSENLRALIAKDRESEKEQRKEIASRETKRRLKRLARLASNFMKQQLEDISELTSGEDIDQTAFSEKGVMIVPTYVRIMVGEEKKLWMYVKKDLINTDNVEGTIHKDSNAIDVIDSTFKFSPHKKRDDRFVGTFRVRGRYPSDSPAYLYAKVDGLPEAEAIVKVGERGVEIRDFTMPLEFQHAQYSVKEGSTRTLRLFALYPDVVNTETPVKVWSDDSSAVVVRGSHRLIPISGTNFARADIVIQGRRLNSKTDIRANVNGRDALATVRVIQKDLGGVPIEIELRPEDFNNFRAMWADHEGKPNLLLISANHKSISRYLGPASTDYEGQESPLFGLLLAEIVADSVCRKILRLDAKDHPWEYRLSDLGDNVAIIERVLALLHRNIRDFVADAHSAMLSDAELAKFI